SCNWARRGRGKRSGRARCLDMSITRPSNKRIEKKNTAAPVPDGTALPTLEANLCSGRSIVRSFGSIGFWIRQMMEKRMPIYQVSPQIHAKPDTGPKKFGKQVPEKSGGHRGYGLPRRDLAIWWVQGDRRQPQGAVIPCVGGNHHGPVFASGHRRGQTGLGGR